MKKYKIILSIFLIYICLFFQKSANAIETSTQETSTQEASTQEASTQEASTQEASTQETSTQETSTQETSSQEASTQETSSQEASTQETSSQEASTQETSTQETSSQETYEKNVANLTKITFEELLNKFHSGEKIYVYIGAAYCGYCRKLSEELPKLNQLLKQKLYYYDVDGSDFDESAFNFLFETLGLPGIPAVLLIDNRTIIEGWIGADITAEDLYQLLTKDEGTKDEGTKDEGTKDEGTKDEGTKDEGTKDEGTKDEGTKDEGTKFVVQEKYKIFPETGYNTNNYTSYIGLIFLGLSCGTYIFKYKYLK